MRDRDADRVRTRRARPDRDPPRRRSRSNAQIQIAKRSSRRPLVLSPPTRPPAPVRRSTRPHSRADLPVPIPVPVPSLAVYELHNLSALRCFIQDNVEPGEEFLCTLNGDFLSPSLLSSLDLGAAAVSAMNAIPVTHACLGNHEFDHSIEVLGQRLAELDCAVVNTNVSLFLFPYFYLLRTGNSTDVVFCLGVRVSAGGRGRVRGGCVRGARVRRVRPVPRAVIQRRRRDRVRIRVRRGDERVSGPAAPVEDGHRGRRHRRPHRGVYHVHAAVLRA